MKLEIDIAKHHYNNIMALDSVSLGRVPYKGIIMYSINAIKHGKVLEQEPKTGHWINRGKQGEVLPFYMRYECSMCGETADKSNYCPNCGAKMAESEGKE
jgi:hypothetical protein